MESNNDEITREILKATENNYEYVDYRDNSIKTANELEPEMLRVHIQKDFFDSSSMAQTDLDYHEVGLTERARIVRDFSFAYVSIMFDGFDI